MINLKMRTVLCDLDHTISNAAWRDPMIGVDTWDEYHSELIHDDPIEEMVWLINSMSLSGYLIVGLTSRPNKFRQLTMDWLVKHGVLMDDIIMRADDAFHPAPELKMAMAIAKFETIERIKNEVAMVIDDREDVCVAFRAIGLTTLQVSARNVYT